MTNLHQHLQVMSHRAVVNKSSTSRPDQQQTRFLLMLSVAVVFCLCTSIRNTYDLTRMIEAYSTLTLAVQDQPIVRILAQYKLGGYHQVNGNNSFSSTHARSNEKGFPTILSSTLTTNMNNMTTSASDDADPRICFVTAQFLTNLMQADRLMNPMTRMDLYDSPNHFFLAFTNHPAFRPRGWTILLRNYSNYRRDITKSRWPKFQGFNDDTIQSLCDVVFYMDGPCTVIGNASTLRTVAQDILQSTVGLAQTPHPRGVGIQDEFLRILQDSKDTIQNVNKSLIWMQSQDDYRSDIPIYQNKYFAYNPKSLTFQRVANFFWDHYSLEQDSWRDQPLWAYSLHHLNVTPMILSNTTLINDVSRHRGMNGHRYNEATDGLFVQGQNVTLNVTDSELCFLNIDKTGGDRIRAQFVNGSRKIEFPPGLPTLYRWRELQMDREKYSDYHVKRCDFIVVWLRDPVERAIDAYKTVLNPQLIKKIRNSGSHSSMRKLRYLQRLQDRLKRFGNLNNLAERLFDDTANNDKRTSSITNAAQRAFGSIEQVRYNMAWYFWSDENMAPLVPTVGPFRPPPTAMSWLTDPQFLSRLVFVGGNECYEQDVERFATMVGANQSYLESTNSRHNNNVEINAVKKLSPLAYDNLRKYFHEDYQILWTLKNYGMLQCDKLIAKITSNGDNSRTFQ